MVSEAAQIGDAAPAQSTYSLYTENKKAATKAGLLEAFDAYQRKESGSLTRLFKITEKAVRGKLYHLEVEDGGRFRDHGQTDDFVQETLMDIWKIVRRGKIKGSYSALVNRIAFTKRADMMRQLLGERERYASLEKPVNNRDDYTGGEKDPDGERTMDKDGDALESLLPQEIVDNLNANYLYAETILDPLNPLPVEIGNKSTADATAVSPVDNFDDGGTGSRRRVKKIIRDLELYTHLMPFDYWQVSRIAMDTIEGEGRGIGREELKDTYASDELGGLSAGWVDKRVSLTGAWTQHVRDIITHRDSARLALLGEAYRAQAESRLALQTRKRPATVTAPLLPLQPTVEQPGREAMAYAASAEALVALTQGLSIASVNLDGVMWKSLPNRVVDVDALVLCELSALTAAQRIQPNVDPSVPLAWIHQHYSHAYNEVLDRLHGVREELRGTPVTRRESRELVDDRKVTWKLMQRAKVRSWALADGGDDAKMSDWQSAEGFVSRYWEDVHGLALTLLASPDESLSYRQVNEALNSTSNPAPDGQRLETTSNAA
jgi:DNA-directed RNA polymerase specialized sigma24 family protein